MLYCHQQLYLPYQQIPKKIREACSAIKGAVNNAMRVGVNGVTVMMKSVSVMMGVSQRCSDEYRVWLLKTDKFKRA